MAATLEAAAVRFGPFRLDMANRLLSRDGAEVPLPPRAMGVLWVLVSRAGHVVSRQDLLDEVWKDAFVSDTSLAEAVSFVRQVLGDDPQSPGFIQTLPRRGYRFVAEVVPDVPPIVAADPVPTHPAAADSDRLWTPWLPYLLFFVAGVIAGLAVMARARPVPVPPRGVVRLSLDLEGGRVEPEGRPLAVTRLGDRLALVIRDRSGAATLRVRRLSDSALATIAASEGASSPFFSPDGRALAFFARGRLWRVPVSGGVPSPIADAPMPLGGTWTSDDTIVFASRWTGGLEAVAAAGGEVRHLTTPERARGELRHAWPDAIESTGRVLFAIAYTPEADDGGRIATLDLRTSEIRRLEAHATDARALPFDHVLLVSPAATAVVPVDSRWQLVTGSWLALPERIRFDRASGGAAVTIASTGVRLALDGPAEPPPFVWVHLTDGHAEPGPSGLDGLDDLALASDGQRAAGVERHGSRADLWIVDLGRGVRARAASAAQLVSPAWSPDGTTVAVAASDGGRFRVVLARADGSGVIETAPSDAGPSTFPSAWTRADPQLVITRVTEARGLDVGMVPASAWLLPGVATGKVRARPAEPSLGPAPVQAPWALWRDVVATPADESAGVVSPDGRWVAYETDDGGRWAIAVRPASAPGATVVAGEGREPAWVDDRSLVFVSGSRLLRVTAGDAGSFDPGPATVVATGIAGLARGVTDDGRVLVRTGLTSSAPSVTLEWFDDLRARLEASQPLPRSFR